MFWAVAFFLGYMWSGGNLTLSFYLMGVVTLSVFVHEMGHAITGLVFRQKVKISLLPFGGLTERRGKPLKGWQEFLIILMGPAFGFMLYLIAKSVYPQTPEGVLRQVVAFTAVANLFWSIVNLLPVLPLDGGQLVRVVLQGIWGTKGLKASCFFSIFFGILFGFYFILRQEFLLASIFAIFVYESWQIYQSVKFLTDEDTDVELQRLMTKGEKAFDKRDFEKAKEIFSQVRDRLKKGVLYNQATYFLAEMAFQENLPEETFSLLKPIFRELNFEGIYRFHRAAMETKAWKEALQSGTKLWEITPSRQLAKDNQVAAEALGDETAAKGWEKAANA